MTPNEINEAIARSLGWMDNPFGGIYPPKLPPQMNIAQKFTTLDYYSDLNACVEFERELTIEQCHAYASELQCCCSHYNWAATAPHRCEAHLRLKGLWK